MSRVIAGYMTPEEFASLVIVSLETNQYFKRNEKAHPEDIVSAFVAQAEAIAIGAGFVIAETAGIKNKTSGI